MKTIKKAMDSSVVARLTASKSGRTLSETTYRAGLSAMKKAIRKDDDASSGKNFERKK